MIPPPEFFSHFFDYVKWADLRQLEVARALGDEEYFKDRGWSFGTIHNIMLHKLSAQNIWLNRFMGEATVWLQDEPRMKEREAIAPEWRGIHDRFTTFLAKQTPQSLAAVVAYKLRSGEPQSVPLWRLLSHVTNHSTHHRGQLNSMLKLAGAKPPVTDYSYYYTTYVQPNS
jgi:uncharacterized damage-inducible protein DinB